MKQKIIILIAGIVIGTMLEGVAVGAATAKRIVERQTLAEKTEIIYGRITHMVTVGGGSAWKAEIDPKGLAALLAEMSGSQQIKK